VSAELHESLPQQREILRRKHGSQSAAMHAAIVSRVPVLNEVFTLEVNSSVPRHLRYYGDVPNNSRSWSCEIYAYASVECSKIIIKKIHSNLYLI
jgi:hypothetical protein